MKEKILQQWNWLRIIRLLIGVAAVVQGLNQGEFILMLAGGFIAISALLNAGCCGPAGCATNVKTVQNKRLLSQKEIEYEEVDAGK